MKRVFLSDIMHLHVAVILTHHDWVMSQKWWKARKVLSLSNNFGMHEIWEWVSSNWKDYMRNCILGKSQVSVSQECNAKSLRMTSVASGRVERFGRDRAVGVSHLREEVLQIESQADRQGEGCLWGKVVFVDDRDLKIIRSRNSLENWFW